MTTSRRSPCYRLYLPFGCLPRALRSRTTGSHHSTLKKLSLLLLVFVSTRSLATAPSPGRKLSVAAAPSGNSLLLNGLSPTASNSSKSHNSSSLAIFRKQDILLRKSPALSTESHPYESPSIAAGFFQLISTYQPLDESFVRAWNDGASADIDIATFLTLQQTLSPPPPFVAPQPNTYQPTLIQKADLLITQQWLRLTVWKSLAATRYRLTRNGPDESTRVTFPLNIAHRTASILISLPAAAVQAHGMGILEKVFEIGRAWVHVTELCELDGGGRATVAINPLGVFIRTLNACMESEKAFARALRALVREKPGVLRGDLGASLSAGNTKIDDRRLVEELGKDDVSEGFETGQLQIEGSSAQRVGLEANASVGHQLSCWGNHTSVSEVGGFSTGWYQDPCPRSHEEVDNLLTPPESGVQVDNALVRTGNSASLYQYGIGLEGSIFPLGHKSFFQM